MLEGKTILITGSARGIGKATAQRAKAYGADVILHGKTASDHLKGLANELECKWIACDVSNREAVHAAVEEHIKPTRKIDALVNCAGLSVRKPFEETTEADWLDPWRLNLLGMVWFSQAVIPLMQGGGRIVNIAGIRAHSVATNPTGMAYCAAKAAVLNFTASLAKAYAPGILVNSISPGYVATDMSKNWPPAFWGQAKQCLAGRCGQPEDIAEAILFLASPRNTFISGQDLLVDGGYSLFGK